MIYSDIIFTEEVKNDMLQYSYFTFPEIVDFEYDIVTIDIVE